MHNYHIAWVGSLGSNGTLGSNGALGSNVTLQ